MENSIYKHIEEFKKITQETEQINSQIYSNLKKINQWANGNNEVGYSTPIKPSNNWAYGSDNNDSLQKKLDLLDDKKKDISQYILKESKKYMISYVGSSNGRIYLAYCFPVDKDKIIKVTFKSQLKRFNASDEFSSSTKGNIETNINSCRGLVNLFDIITNTPDDKRILFCETSKESSIVDFLKKTSSKYLENLESYLDEFKLTDFRNEKLIIDTKNHFSWLHSKIYDAVLHLDIDSAISILKPITFDTDIVADFINYSKEKDKERLFYVLENNLVSETKRSNLPKI